MDIVNYASTIDNVYQEDNKDDIFNDTYICAMFLPPSVSSNYYLISHPNLDGVDYLKVDIPRHKHLSINTLAVK